MGLRPHTLVEYGGGSMGLRPHTLVGYGGGSGDRGDRRDRGDRLETRWARLHLFGSTVAARGAWHPQVRPEKPARGRDRWRAIPIWNPPLWAARGKKKAHEYNLLRCITDRT